MGEHPADMNAPLQLPRHERKFGMMGSLAELRKEEWVPFTLGPLHVYGKVTFDIPSRFFADTGFRPIMSWVDFGDFPLLTIPKVTPEQQWHNHRLFVMDDMAYPHFADWLLTVEIINREEQRFTLPIRTAAPIMDPFMRFIGTATPTPEVIDVWSVSDMQCMLLPQTHVEQLPYPIFKEGEAEELSRAEFLRRLPKPTTAPASVTFRAASPDPRVIVRGHQALGRQVEREG